MSKAIRERAKRREVSPKTKELMAKNVKPGHIVILRGGLGIIDVASNEKTPKGNRRRISEAPVLRPGNRRKRALQRRCVVVDPSAKMEVVK